jgi:hypothetical protein
LPSDSSDRYLYLIPSLLLPEDFPHLRPGNSNKMDSAKPKENQYEHEEKLNVELDDIKDNAEGRRADEPVIDDAWHNTGKRLVRKLDMTLMPIIWALYLFNYLDRTSIA